MSNEETEVVLVDKNDSVLGRAEKMAAHKQGRLHRCFSIFLFNNRGEVLLQKRAENKYHSPGLWSNTCCSHPRPGKALLQEAKRRLKQEMGIETELKEVFTFIYKTKVGALIEHEFDHVFFGRFDGSPKPNPEEVADWRWTSLPALKKDIKKHPRKYTTWLKIVLPAVIKTTTKAVYPVRKGGAGGFLTG